MFRADCHGRLDSVDPCANCLTDNAFAEWPAGAPLPGSPRAERTGHRLESGLPQLASARRRPFGTEVGRSGPRPRRSRDLQETSLNANHHE